MTNMVRTQVYITAAERAELSSIARITGEKQSMLIRKAIDKFVAHFKKTSSKGSLEKAFGIWKDRKDFRNLKKVRQELDRSFD